jgi:hypothetical protein
LHPDRDSKSSTLEIVDRGLFLFDVVNPGSKLRTFVIEIRKGGELFPLLFVQKSAD